MKPRERERHKRQVLLEYAQDFGMKFFVETGTYKGDTTKAMLMSGLFDEIHTIETYEDRYERAKRRFQGHPSVHCWHGDSGKMMPQILDYIAGPCLFWLDAHHSGKQIARTPGLIDTPLMSELAYVLEHQFAEQHVILVDDARYFEQFGGKVEGYPTMDMIREVVRHHLNQWTCHVTDDILRIYGPGALLV